MFEKHTDVESRLLQFRAVRKSSLSEEDVLESFGKIKIQSRYLDYWTPTDWLNPFEIIEHGYFCTTGISLLLYHTLANLNYLDPAHVEWKVISNHVTGKDGGIFFYDGYAYNLAPGKKVKVDAEEELFLILKEHKDLHIPII